MIKIKDFTLASKNLGEHVPPWSLGADARVYCYKATLTSQYRVQFLMIAFG